MPPTIPAPPLGYRVVAVTGCTRTPLSAQHTHERAALRYAEALAKFVAWYYQASASTRFIVEVAS